MAIKVQGSERHRGQGDQNGQFRAQHSSWPYSRMLWETFALWVVALQLLRDCGLPDVALYAVHASSIDFPAI